MYSLDVDVQVWRDVPWRGVCGQITGREGVPRRWSMLTQSGVVGELAPVERGEAPADDRPCARVGGRFAGEVAGVELLEGGIEIVKVEGDVRRDPLVAVDLVDAECIDVERLGPLVAPE